MSNPYGDCMLKRHSLSGMAGRQAPGRIFVFYLSSQTLCFRDIIVDSELGKSRKKNEDPNRFPIRPVIFQIRAGRWRWKISAAYRTHRLECQDFNASEGSGEFRCWADSDASRNSLTRHFWLRRELRSAVEERGVSEVVAKVIRDFYPPLPPSESPGELEGTIQWGGSSVLPSAYRGSSLYFVPHADAEGRLVAADVKGDILFL